MLDKDIRGIEAKMISGDDIYMVPASSLSPPTKIERVLEVKVDCYPRTVCRYKGVTYVGLESGKVCRIGGIQLNDVSVFVTLNDWIMGITANADRLYILKRGSPYVVFVFNLEGQQLLKWDFENQSSQAANAMAIVNNQLLLADNTNACITIYTLNGE